MPHVVVEGADDPAPEHEEEAPNRSESGREGHEGVGTDIHVSSLRKRFPGDHASRHDD